ncbi:hypothetical protein AN643_02795 [Candidatus Epulonipiscioides saccharophilum]|nr:hypothetical protein AN643_02795 [Epulopiscium sp. SCG-B10WGA-EpuloB]
MNERIPITSGEIIFGKDFLNYKAVLDDFKRAKCIRVMTYNISKNNDKNGLINALKNVSEDVDIKIITNIPSRMDCYHNSDAGKIMRKNSKNNVDIYLKKLNPENFSSNTEVRFNFSNHAKIIGTENVLYIGSANYSDESKNNFEIGIIITNTEIIQKVYEEIFLVVIKESIPYFEDDFNNLRLFVSKMEKEFKCWLDGYECRLTNYNSGNNLYPEYNFTILREILKELHNIDSLLTNTYTELDDDDDDDDDDDYNTLIDEIQTELYLINIEWMLRFTSMCSEKNKANNWVICEEWIMYEERNCYYRINLCDEIKTIIKFLEDIHEGILKYSYKWINKKIDNTGL